FKLQEYGINYVEVNLSVVQMLNSNVYERLSNMIKESGVPTSMINFEITESTLIENFSNVSSIMKKFNDDGITFSLDDFGTGYSNFTYIYEMPFQIIKIDRSILLNADSNEVADKMLNSLVNMLKGINVTVLQEGVETKPQRDKIISYGVDYIQGFLYSKPLPEEDFIEYVKINNA
nr:EAL domain-containing protein [Gammaproteobacteria bacterium]